MKPIRTFAALTLISTLAACGLKGGLEKPPPLFGETRRQFDAELKAKADAAEAAEKAKAEKARETVTIPVAPKQ